MREEVNMATKFKDEDEKWSAYFQELADDAVTMATEAPTEALRRAYEEVSDGWKDLADYHGSHGT